MIGQNGPTASRAIRTIGSVTGAESSKNGRLVVLIDDSSISNLSLEYLE